jgi:hypothetical protein
MLDFMSQLTATLAPSLQVQGRKAGRSESTFDVCFCSLDPTNQLTDDSLLDLARNVPVNLPAQGRYIGWDGRDEVELSKAQRDPSGVFHDFSQIRSSAWTER